MCDTMCATPQYTGGDMLFAKNSDRSPNEPHLVVRVPAADHAAGSTVKLTYITIPQAAHTLAALLCKPSWTWGAEMGVNEAGLAIGNEAVFTRAKRGPDALLGMDLLRLALERCETAKAAVEMIAALLEQYGQGGNCGFDHNFYYDNSFLIADPDEAYVLETSGRRWVAERVDGFRAISNRLTIGTEHTLRGGVEEGFDFAKRLTEPVFTHFSGSKLRLGSSCSIAPKNVADMMAALRAHDPRDEAALFPKGSVRSVCMHAGGAIGDHTTGSLVAQLRRGKPMTLWVTGASTPCISAFKPVFFGVDSGAPVFSVEADAKQYWLKREAVHRGVLAGQVDVAALRAKRDALEADWLAAERKLMTEGADNEEQRMLAVGAAAEEQALIDAVRPQSVSAAPSPYWRKKNAALEKL
jgi:dipeptidase